MKRFTFLFLSIGLFFILFPSCENLGSAESKNQQNTSSIKGLETDLPLENIKLPEGFEIVVYANDVPDARSMVLSPSGILYVGNRKEDKVYAVVDENQDFIADKTYTLATGLNMPCGVAFKDGDLYVAEVNRILKFKDIENNLDNPPNYEVIYDKLPTIKHHGWKFIDFGPDDKLYIPVGAPCNICDSALVREEYASITRMNADGSDLEVFAHGVRNSVGFTWHPDTKEMWFTDNGRDMLGDDVPPCELNRVTEAGQHFGYPYCHGGDISDPEFGDGKNCGDYIAPAQKLGPHVAPLGIRFADGDMFPAEYQKQLFFAEHGSWNRSEKIGYRISLARLDGTDKVKSYETFAEGWLNETTQEVWGRPVDVQFLPDGSMLVSDDMAGVIYRIVYTG